MKRGFTMVELLVVVGILGILMAILVGTFGGSTESARTTQCMSNMRNLAMAVQAVAIDGGYYPAAGSYVKGKSTYRKGWVGWSSDSAGGYGDLYEKDPKTRTDIYENGSICKAMNGNRSSYVCPGHVRFAQEKNLGEPLWSYAMNAYFGWAGNPMTHGRRYKSFKRSDRYLLFSELPRSKELAGDESDPVLQYPGCQGGGDEKIAFNHMDGKISIATVCFADGHCEKLVAPKEGDVKELTTWLCRPHDDQGNDFDISFDGKRYRQVK